MLGRTVALNPDHSFLGSVRYILSGDYIVEDVHYGEVSLKHKDSGEVVHLSYGAFARNFTEKQLNE